MRLTRPRGPVAAASLALSFVLASIVLAADPSGTVSHKGWSSDEGGAKGKVASGDFGPTGGDCVAR